MRSGRRASRGSVVVHLARVEISDGVRPALQTLLAQTSAAQRSGGQPPRGQVEVGFVVSRAVGGSVVRHRVVRRLRAIVAARLDDLVAQSGSNDRHQSDDPIDALADRVGSRTLLVVRALPSAADASSSELARDLDAALAAARRPRPARSPSGTASRVSGGRSR